MHAVSLVALRNVLVSFKEVLWHLREMAPYTVWWQAGHEHGGNVCLLQFSDLCVILMLPTALRGIFPNALRTNSGGSPCDPACKH